MNSENSKKSNPYNSLLKVIIKVDLRSVKKCVALPNLSNPYTRKKYKILI